MQLQGAEGGQGVRQRESGETQGTQRDAARLFQVLHQGAEDENPNVDSPSVHTAC